MYRAFTSTIAMFALMALPLFSDEVTPNDKVDEETFDQVSEAFGHLIGKNIDTLGIKFDLKRVIKGLQDSSEGKVAPMSESECIQAISTAQEKAFKNQAVENLKKADDFLNKNAKENAIISVGDGKVQYKIEKSGTGEEIKEHYSPLIRYVGKYLDGTVFGSSKEDEMISLDETIAGFSKGLLGMKEGEKRTLFIHPDYAYGTSGYLPPNSLLTFEIELVKANVPQNLENETISVTPAETNQEIASDLQTEVIR
ncbi:MAG TPA: FKBP-type peptidyl-prolyl cis-trans isomerase [Rhabdochlamydiaceae bacterium]|nr:FKBP-type peptidyl-prolyl cis-trans isomerase [Rhabdochlamydiaceae bacterium]